MDNKPFLEIPIVLDAKQTLKDAKDIGSDFKKMFGMDSKSKTEFSSLVSTLQDNFFKKFKSEIPIPFTNFTVELGDVLESGVKKLQDMMESSYLTNETTRRNLFTYGMNAAQSYGFETAKDMLGINSDEDLLYMSSDQVQLFQEMMTKYSQKYSELYDSGYYSKMLEFNVTMKELQEDLLYWVADFLVDNKEIIKMGMEAIMSIANTVMEILAALGKIFGVGSTSDVINNYSTGKNISVSIDNTFNTSSSTSQDMLNNVGKQTYASTIEALKTLVN